MNAKRFFKKPGLRYVPVLLLLAAITACTRQGEIDTTLPEGDANAATPFTKDSLAKVRAYLPFDTDKTDLYFANYGFVTNLANPSITEGPGDREIYNTQAFAFIGPEAVDGDYPNTVNPSLWRQSYLNQLSGLFELLEGEIFQIRGFDLANMSIVKDLMGGWIVIDPLGSPGTAKAGIDLFNKYINPNNTGAKIQINAVIFTHSHLDHFGGVTGLEEYFPEARESLTVVAPVGFFEEAVSENVMAGNCMGRRATYMYGNLLGKDTLGTLGSGLGTQTSTGVAGIMKETISIDNDDNGVPKSVAGRSVVFWNAPSSEAPSEMIFYFPELKAFCQAEEINHTLHNLLTLRGAKVRNGLLWSKYIDKAIELWGDEVELSFGSHHWPTIKGPMGGSGNFSIKEYWEGQRDLYRYIHDQTLRLANQGYTMDELAEMIHLPRALDQKFHARGYYGSVNHDIKAQYQLYFGWFDGNPANLNPLPPTEAGKAYIQYLGRDEIYSGARKAYVAGNYRFAAELLNKLVFADDSDANAKELLARCYLQMGYIAESGPWRNFYLTGAQELRETTRPSGPAPAAATPEIIKNMSNELLLDYLAMKYRGNDPGAGELDFVFDLTITEPNADNNERALLIVSNGAVTARMNPSKTDDATGTVSIKREDINALMSNEIEMGVLIERAIFGSEASKEDFTTFTGFIDEFDFWFDIVRNRPKEIE